MNSDMIMIIAGSALVTYCTRFPLLIFSTNKNIPAWLSKYLSFIAPAVLTALIVPVVFIKQGKLAFSIANEYIIASIITVIIAYFFKNMLAAVIVGMLTVAFLVYII
jgi:branched-subunit amino acid transport protein